MNIIVKYKNFKKRFVRTNQFCKCCGKDMDYDYSVDEETWEELPQKYHNHVLCIHCFCELYPKDLNKVNFKFYQLFGGIL